MAAITNTRGTLNPSAIGINGDLGGRGSQNVWPELIDIAKSTKEGKQLQKEHDKKSNYVPRKSPNVLFFKNPSSASLKRKPGESYHNLCDDLFSNIWHHTGRPSDCESSTNPKRKDVATVSIRDGSREDKS